MVRNLKPIPEPVFLVPADLPKFETFPPSQKHQNDGILTTNVIKTDNLGLLLTRYIPHQVIRNNKGDAIVEINQKGNEVKCAPVSGQ